MKNFENLSETTNSSREVFKGKVVHLFEDEITLPNGHKTTREVIRHIGAVGIVAITDDNKVIIEKQFRYPYKGRNRIYRKNLDKYRRIPSCRRLLR